MASERAKELAAKQKAERKAAKLRKKTSDNPRDWSWPRQIVEVFKRTKEYDPQLIVWMVGAFAAAVLAMVILGIVLDAWLIYSLLGLFLGVTAALWVLLWRAKGANYRRYHGEKGSAEVALSELDKKKWDSETAIAIDKSMNLVHRTVGPAGIVLIGEGDNARGKQLLATEQRRHEQVAYGTPVTAIMMGDGADEVPLEQLSKRIKKLPKKLQAHQLIEVKQRLKALDAVRPKVPIPRGPIPNMRGAHRAMRGR
ncbi:DUF4191 domain-containing protein [Propionicicella superfundia]|uniref:DUF4191 domain-containing protein n=1 Tax=Propionicicella superfundia TaxID=348582 RepID=UPI00040EEEB0|nr:DUF4191 domain-containing protein [Propionicicella superfundia]